MTVICAQIIKFFLIISIYININNASICQQTVDYIDGKLRNSKVDIAKAYIQNLESVMTEKYDIKMKVLWTRELDSRALTIGRTADEMFVLIENDRVMSIGINLAPPDLQSAIGLHDVSTFTASSPMKFIKSLIWQKLMYLLICYEANFCAIFTSTGGSYLQYQHSTRHPGKPVDANFFILNNQLYLVIATNLDSLPSASVIYRWTGTYMDVMTEIDLKSVISVVTFVYRGTAILVFSQNDGKSNIGSQIYKLIINEKDGQGSREFIQFLETSRPVGMHLYHHNGCTFLLVLNEAEASQVFWWDGKEFLPWIDVNIEGPSILNSVEMNNDTFLFVAQGNHLRIYKITSAHYELLDKFPISDVIRIADMGVWSEGQIISIVLIAERAPNLYRVEPWHLFVNKVNEGKKGNALITAEDETESAARCMKSLMIKLRGRMKDVEDLRASWNKLHSASEDVVIDELEADVILRSPESSLVLESLEIVSENREDIIPPKDLELLVQNLQSKIEKSLNKSQNLMRIDNISRKLILSSLTVTNTANFEELQTPMLITRLMNNADPNKQLENSISATKNQTFNEALQGADVSIQNLEVDFLCGVPKKFWLLRNETMRVPLKPITGPADVKVHVEIGNDTVSMTSDLFIPRLEAEVLNSVNLSEFLNNLFFVGKNQVIDGDVFFSDVFIEDLDLEELNGVPRGSLMTIGTDQDFEDSVYVDALNVQRLEVKRINGISLDEAARVSEENVIKGKVVLNHLTITDELIVDENCSLFKQAQQVQVYEDVTILGNVTIRQLLMEDRTNVELQHRKMRGNDVDDLFATSWTKSGDQKILAPVVTFEKGLTIDELDAEYLNGLKKNDYLYTTDEKIPQKFGALHFAELAVNGTVHRENQTKKLVEIDDDTVIFNERVVFKKLAALNFFSESYNGIPISFIMNSSKNFSHSIAVSLPDNLKFEKITVNDDLEVTNLNFKTLNHKEYSKILFTDEDHKVESIKSEKFKAANFRSSAGISRRAAELQPSEEMNIVIDGPLIVDGNLQIDQSINQQTIENYLKQLSTSDIRVHDPTVFLDELIVLQDGTINNLYGIDFEEFLNSIFSKSKNQTLRGRKIFHRVTAKSVVAGTINGKRIEQMHFINNSLTFDSDVIFKTLSADVDTKMLNGASTTWINGDLSSISSRNITRMTLTGNATWRNDSSPRTLSNIITNAVRTNSDDVIEAPVDFTNFKDVHISSVSTNHSSFSVISDVVRDAVVNNSNSIARITGKKRFLNDAEVQELYADNIAIDKLETTTIRELNASIVRKFDDNTVIPGTCVFTGEGTSILHLIAQNPGPGMPNISSLFVLSDEEENYVPNETHFEHLIINDDVFLKSLDGVNFDEFLRQRVTLTGNHTIASSVRFNGHIQVTGNVQVDDVNGIIPSDVVLKNPGESQVIGGEKVFLTDLVVDGNVEAPLFNGIDIVQEYKQGVLNSESPVINGDLVIEGSIELQQDPVVLGRVNGLRLDTFMEDVEFQRKKHVEMIGRNMTDINDSITNAVALLDRTRHPEIFNHFEIEENLKISVIHNVTSVVPLIFGDSTKLNAYGTQSGDNCPGLPQICTCRSQYVINISGNSSEYKNENSSWIVFNFRQPSGQFVINVVTNTISSSLDCSKNDGSDEYTAISWMTRNGSISADEFTHYPEKIKGYLNDAKVFVHASDAYIVLALSYDPRKRTHHVDSLIFRLDLKSNTLNQVLKIPMISASAVEVFRVHERGSHVLIASGAAEDPEESAKSLIFRIKPGTKKFELLRSFYSGGSRRIKSLSYRNEDFLLLDDVKMNALHIYNYERIFDNFYLYQSLYFDGEINSVETFYAGEYRWSDAFVIITVDNRFFVYQYMMVGRFQEVMSKWVHGALAVTPFYLPEGQFLFVTARDNSSVYRIVGQGH